MATVLAVVIATGVLAFVYGRLQRARNALQSDEEEKPKRKSKRQRRLDQIRANDPPFEPKSMFDLMLEEAAELGIDEIPAADGLEIPVKLKVWRRDSVVRENCAGIVRYEIDASVDPAVAGLDDVRLVCDDSTAGKKHGKPS